MSDDEERERTSLITLVERSQDGDAASFAQLVDRFAGSLLRLSYRMLGNMADAEDIVQESFMSAWLGLSSLRHPEAFSTWLYQQTVNKCTDHLRRRQKQDSVSIDNEETGDGVVADTRDDPQRQAEETLTVNDLTRWLQELPVDLRVCWVLREVHGLSYAEVSQILDVPESTVRGRLSRARTALSRAMKEWR
ncbi:sigma-70 family RNA polymerase sigma factor [Actinomycetaceae bacterium L2_0104]